MKSLKLLFCGCLVSLLGCAGSEPAAKRSVNADEARAQSSQAFDALDGKQVSDQPVEMPVATPAPVSPVMTVDASKGSLSDLLHSYACPNADDLRGQGIAGDANSALTLAQKEIAAKIQSVVVAKTQETRQANVDAAGKESIQSSFEAKTQVITRLQNAQDAKPIVTLTMAGKYGVAACMRKSDAAKPFVKEAGLLQDSVTLAAKLFEEQKHPIIKNKAFKTVRDVYVRSLAVQDVLDGLGVKSENRTKTIYESVLQKYNGFRSQYAFYYQENKNADANVVKQSRLVFERISAKYPVRAAACSNGLMLTLSVSPAVCDEKSLGFSCTATLNLNGSSCDGESYFSINANVKGSGRYDAKEAQDRLSENVAKGYWFEEWTMELDKWRLE